MKKITNDIIIDNLIYFLVKNILNITRTLYVIISVIIGFSFSHIIATHSTEYNGIFVGIVGTLSSILLLFFICIIDGHPYGTYYSTMFSEYIKHKYNIK